jgi:hypothetical protein
MSFIENGTIRVGVDLNDGGKITYLSRVRGDQAHDLLQDAQQSYYGGTPDAPWHVAADGGTVVVNRNDGRTIYTKVIPCEDISSTLCTRTLETWVTLDANTVHVRNRLTETGRGNVGFIPHPQELPAVYTTGDAYRLFTYDGDAPFTAAPIREITDDRGGFFVPGPTFLATEHWAALVNDEGFGVGLFNPQLTRFSGIPGNEYAAQYGWVNGYVAASTTEVLDSTPVYSYDYTLVVGNLDEIRAYAARHRPDPRPKYLFRLNRQHWWEVNASDSARSVNGALRLYPDRSDPQLYGPETSFPASSVRALYVRGAWHTKQNTAQLFWNVGGGFDGDHVTTFYVVPDAGFHTYRIPLLGNNGWSGTIRGLRLDVVNDAEPGRWVDIACISWRPCPHERRVERRLTRSTPATVFFDSFDTSFNERFWSREVASPGTTMEATRGRLVLTVDPGAQAAAGSGVISDGIDSVCRLAGNYDVTVDYRLLEWPAAGGVDLQLATGSGRTVGRRSVAGEVYFGTAGSRGGETPTSDLGGSLRLARAGTSERAYYRRDVRWILLWQSTATRGPTQMQLAVRAAETVFSHQEVQIAFDNFRVRRGFLSCP